MKTYPTKFDKAMFWSLAAAIALVPLFSIFGAQLLGADRGLTEGDSFPWTRTTTASVLFVFHITMFWLAFCKNRQTVFEPSNYHVSPGLARCLSFYYFCHLMVQLLFSCKYSSSSVMNQWIGIDQWVSSEVLCVVFIYATILAGVAVLCLLCLWNAKNSNHVRTRQEEEWEAAERQLFLEEFV